MKRLLPAAVKILALVLLLTTAFLPAQDASAGLFDGWVPTSSPTPSPTPLPTPSPTPIPTPSPTPSPTPRISDIAVLRGELDTLLGVPTVTQTGISVALVYEPVLPEQLTDLFILLDKHNTQSASYDFALHKLTVYATSSVQPTPRVTNRPILSDDDKCSTCLGSGKCWWCDGEGTEDCTGQCIGGDCLACSDGYTYNYNGKKVRCSICGGDSHCNKCGGDGKMKCTECNGKRTCPSCGGKR